MTDVVLSVVGVHQVHHHTVRQAMFLSAFFFASADLEVGQVADSAHAHTINANGI